MADNASQLGGAGSHGVAQGRASPITVRFSVHYATRPGENLVACGDSQLMGQWVVSNGVRLSYTDGGWWEGEVTFPSSARPSTVHYKYVLEASGDAHWEFGPDRKLDLGDAGGTASTVLLVADVWQPKDPLNHSVFRTSAFEDAVFRRDAASPRPDALPTRLRAPRPQGTVRLRFAIDEPRVGPGDALAITGSAPGLGEWEKHFPLRPGPYPRWEGEVDVPATALPCRYKYVIVRAGEKGDCGASLVWECGEDRVLARPSLTRGVGHAVVTDRIFRFPSSLWRGAGVAVPVFSLRSDAGMGIGEFRDVEDLAEWASSVGLRMIQLLPVNDTTSSMTWRDSYPYSGISVQALHPMYLHLPDVLCPPEHGTPLPAAAQDVATEVQLATQRLRTGAETPLDYDAVLEAKTALLRAAYNALGADHAARADYADFVSGSAVWLRPYALFRVLRDKFGDADFSQWGRFATVSQEELDAVSSAESTAAATEEERDLARGMRFYEWVQYHCHLQLRRAALRANACGVVLKGDLPIGVSRQSVESWFQPHLFNLDKQTGAPPDAFSETGQNWEFPTYNWDAMARDGYRWWRQRLVHMSQYFQAYRIDHILGFFRIWEIPRHAVSGLLGRFNPAHGISRDELREHGIWDLDRLTLPYIRWWTLHQAFGDGWHAVASRYLDEVGSGVFRPKPRVATERQVHAAVAVDGAAVQADADLSALGADRIRDGLCGLITNVCLLHDPESDTFHPRIRMAHCSSFAELEDHSIKGVLLWLYNEYFFNRQESLWASQALEKLPALQQASRMLVCGEDLGMVPDCVPGVMDELGICSLRVQRMPKDLKREFGVCQEYPYLSVCTPSTHDTSTLRGWWEEDAAASQRYFNHVLGHPGQAPPFCDPWLADEIVRQHLHAPSIWAVFPIQDLLACNPELRRSDPHAERINVPANPRHFWCYRLHLTTDQLKQADAFNTHIQRLLMHSARLEAY